MTRLADLLGAVLFVFPWFAGIVLAQGAVSTVIAVLLPPWALYLFVERAMQIAGWL